MKDSGNRIVAVYLLAAVLLFIVGLSGPAAAAPTLDISAVRITPNPGYSCDNTTISFNVTNNLGQVADLITVSVTAKNAAGGMSWQSNITMLADRATSQQSFTWTNPPEGTYDISITVIGVGQIAQKSGVYTVLPCAPHITLGSISFAPGGAPAFDNGTVTVEVINDGHAPAYNTTVAVQVAGPYPDTTVQFLGSTLLPVIEKTSTPRSDFMWQPIKASGVYEVTAMAIDDTGALVSVHQNIVVDLRPHPNVMKITGISVDPYPPMQGQEGNVTAELMFEGNWTGVLVDVMAYADGPSSYFLGNQTLQSPATGVRVKVKFPWLSTIEPGRYDVTVTAVMFNPKEYTVSKTTVTQMAAQKKWQPANFRLEINGLRMAPYPPLPGQNSTITVEVANTGGADAPPAKVTVTAEGPAFYNLGTRTTPSTSFGTMVRLDFNWTQPVVPGEYTIRAFLEDAGGNQSELRKTYPMPHVLESNLSVVNGSAVYNYYYYGGAPNGTPGQNVTVTVKETGEGAATGLVMSNPAVAGATGVAVGGAVSAISVLIYAYASKKGYDYYKSKGSMSSAQTNPMYEDKGMSGQNPMYEERKVHAVHRGEHVDEPPAEERALVGGALPGGAVISAAVSSGIRESPTRPSTGQTSIRESPSRPSTGKVRESPTLVSTGGGEELPKESVDFGGAPPAPEQSSNPIPGVGIVVKRAADYGSAVRESPTQPSTGPTSEKKSKVAAIGRVETPLGLQGTRESPTRATAVTDADGDASSEARMAINEKGLPGPKKPSAHRLAGNGIEPVDPDDDGDGLPTIDERKGWDGTIKGVKVDETGSEVARKGWDGKIKGSNIAEEGQSGDLSRKGWDGTIKGVKVDEDPSASRINKGWDGTIKGVKVDEGAPEAASKKGYDYYQAQSQLNSAGKVRESPTRASGLRESPTLPSKGQTSARESPSQATPPTGDLDGDGAPDLRAQNNNTTRSNRTERSAAADDPSKEEKEAREKGLSENRDFSSIDNAPEEKERGLSGLKGHRDVGGYRAPDGSSGTGGGAPAQDHNSVRSNKSSSALDDGGGESGGGQGDDTARKGWDGKIKGSNIDEGQSGDLARKGWDGTVKGSTKADEAPEGTDASKPVPGIGVIVKSNKPHNNK